MPGRLRNQVHLCDLGYTEGVTPLIADPPESPDCELHTPMPSGYVARSDWADRMMKTHDVRKCRGCGKYQVWEPKPRRGSYA